MIVSEFWTIACERIGETDAIFWPSTDQGPNQKQASEEKTVTIATSSNLELRARMFKILY